MKFNQETIATLGGQVTGNVLLASGTISSPVAFFDLTLPVGYSSFSIKIENLFFSVTGTLALAFSFDSGASFLNDAPNSDSYLNNNITMNVDVANTVGAAQFGDSLVSSILGSDPSQHVSGRFILDIDPGSSDSFLQLYCLSTEYNVFQIYKPGFNIALALVNPDATIPVIPARANLIRILPYGNGDCNPPTSGHTITAGSYFLWGVPTP